jgi:hypothetical protein
MPLRTLVLVFALLLGASHAHAQQAPGPRRPSAMPSATAFPASDRSAAEAPMRLHGDAAARRSGLRYPLIGAALGVVVGIGVGAYFHSDIEPGTGLAGPPAYFMTVPLGAIGGAVLGAVANIIDSPSSD